ncbi:TetR/AcrR family transcriptional regulator [Streptomyces sp. NPDC059491]|uniref:TetR/AcrR family transcriptional regulator n=1 Tax=Streptomyces sp. NPDC059491 TaxID=3346850 RepID=UPI0036823013
MNESSPRPGSSAASKRKDAQRNQQTLLDAAAAVFVTSGVDAPVREIAAKAGVGLGTFYRHFPSRADLVIAVYRHQVDTCAEAGPALLSAAPTPFAALEGWVDLFVDFLVTKHGLAAAMQADSTGFEALHAYFLDRLLPVCSELLAATVDAGETRPDVDAYGLMRGIGNLCIGTDTDPRYDPRRLVGLLLVGLRQSR